jgi:hypothetical protein
MTMKDEQWLALIARICRNRNFQSEERRRDIHRFLLECQEVDVVIQTQNISFESTQNLWQKLPWHWWDFFAQDHFTDVALSFSNSESVISDEEEPRLSQPKRVKILCVLGKPGNEQDKNKIDGVVLSIFLSLILIERETGLIDTIVTSREKAARYSIFGLIGGSIYVLIRLHFTDRYDLSNLEHIFDIFIELLIFTTLPGLIGLLDKGENLAQTIIPNQGVWKSAQNAGLFFSIFFPVGMLCSLNYAGGLHEVISIGLAVGLIAAMAGGKGPVFAGVILIQHFTLRLILWLQGYTPWNYARFLDYATERVFIRKVGGGYIFIHRILQEHFSQMHSRTHH